MAIIKWGPAGKYCQLAGPYQQAYSTIRSPARPPRTAKRSQCAWTPSVDIFETDQGVVIAADLPGVNKKENVVVEVKDEVLTISGVNDAPIPEYQATNYYRRERICGNFHRTFTLHAMVSPEEIKAKFKNGVLVVQVPKPEEDETQADIGGHRVAALDMGVSVHFEMFSVSALSLSICKFPVATLH
jgi:HSP20 family protein